MWFFNCPEFYFGEDALSQLEMLPGKRAYIVTDPTIQQLGFVDVVQKQLQAAGIETAVFANVEPDPSLQTVRQGAKQMLDYNPDWIIGLGGGSSMDAAKAMWILYERPDIEPEAISPMEDLGLRQKARLICIPTTAGTGAESNYGIVLTDTAEKRKLTLGSREATPDMAIVDPRFTLNLPAQITADTGIDVWSHAIEAFSCSWANDFTDGLCLQAADLVQAYLPRVVKHGAADAEAREKMANAAAIAGMVLGNSQVALAHAMGHSAGAVFKTVPHGRITAVFLPYTIQFVANSGLGRYANLARYLGLPHGDDKEAGLQLAETTFALMREIGLPTNLQEADIKIELLENNLDMMVEHVEIDTNTLMSRRIPESEDVIKLFQYAFDGKPVDF
ncbi:MAG: iron-containing alcohol dehydrogenase [Chloroflexi bacterium]|nr:iron-containing alcohol dehydrogenase [Chloroflexota bacterium]